MPVCDVCGKIVKDIRRHKERGRCGVKGRDAQGKPARYVPGTPESRLAMDGAANYATYAGTGEPADFINLKKRLKR
jgi:hypothetical protein